MGRKPNQIIQDYFERGQKLEDASNRYQHTCRSCGEKFPKGRIDTLINHLVKRCPCLSVQQRTEISLRAHEVPRTVQTPPKSNDNSNPTNEPQNGVNNCQSMELGYTSAPQHEMSALETLAEVSRQQHLLSEQVNGGDGRRESGQESGMQPAFMPEDFLVQEPPQQGLESAHGASRNVQNGPEIQDSNGLQTAHIYEDPPQSSSPHPAITSAPSEVAPTAQMVPSPLEIAASAAQELQAQMASNANLTVEPEAAVQSVGGSNGAMTERFFGQRPSWASNIDPQLQQGEHAQNAIAELLRNGVAAYPRPIAINPHQQQLPYPEVSMTHTRQKPKARGRFSDHRRKEVQDVRKRGACIRCRMLKKPCSGEDPCSTCVNVESARLWKSPCIRTRIAEEFNLYATGLHAVLAFHDVNRAKGLATFQPLQGRFEIAHFPDIGLAATFQGIRSQKLSSTGIDPVLLASTRVATGESNIEMLDAEGDDLASKLELYLRNVASAFFERERSAFMKPTLLLAQRLVREQNDTLLQRALDLWVATQMLTDTTTLWNIFYNPTLPPQPGPVQVQIASPENTSEVSYSSTQPLPSDSPSYRLISSQLAAATEKHCATFCKSALNELEKRLLQRHYSSPFSTFLAAVILLACIECIASVFQGWEDPNAPPPSNLLDQNEAESVPTQDTPIRNGQASENLEHFPQSDREIAQRLLAAANPPLPLNPQPGHQVQPPATPVNGIPTTNPDTEMTNSTLDTSNANLDLLESSPAQHQASQASPSHPTVSGFQPSSPQSPPGPNGPAASSALPRYPLDRSPGYYVNQGERFAHILHMLLKMRGLPPKIRLRPSSPSLSGASRTKLLPAESPNTSSSTMEVNGITDAESRRSSGGVGQGTGTSDALVREWLESLGDGVGPEGRATATEGQEGGGVSEEWLRSRIDAEFMAGNARCWEGKWVARLLLGI